MKNTLGKQAGASILEFLIVIPIFLLLAFTAIEFGAVFTRLNTITKSVQDATRYLSATHRVFDDAVEITIKEGRATNLIVYASAIDTGQPVIPGLDTTDTSITRIDQDGDGNDDHVSVSVNYLHQPVGGQTVSNLLQMITGAQVNLSFPLRASSVMRYTQ